MLEIIGIILITISFAAFICWYIIDVESNLSKICVVLAYYSASTGICLIANESQSEVTEQTYKDCLLGKNKYNMEIHYKMLPDSTYIPSDTLFIKIK